MSSYPRRTPSLSFRAVLRPFGQGGAAPLSALLTAEDIDLACREEGVPFALASHHVWTPALTVGTLLSQCLSDSTSCVAAVARALTPRADLGLPACSAATGAYRKAGAKLPAPLPRRRATQVGGALERQALPGGRRKGRRVRLADGPTASGPDTPANQAEYPQPRTQKPGRGFPRIRPVVLLGFATAARGDAALGPWSGKRNGEMALLRQLLGRLLANDVPVADRASCSYWRLAELQRRGAGGAFRLHRSRHADFSKGRQLGRDDPVIVWSRPARPAWMDRDTYLAVPKQMEIRAVRSRVARPGYRREIIVATTLLDAERYSKDDRAELYGDRWRVELDVREIKQTLSMDVLRGKTPPMLRRERWAHLLAYNWTRQAAAQAALRAGRPPRRVSFAGAKQTPDAFRAALQAGEGDGWRLQAEAMLTAVATPRVGQRDGRCEPRQGKRRPKVFPMMTKPRGRARAALVTAGVGEMGE